MAACLLLVGCASVNTDGSSNCLITAKGDWEQGNPEPPLPQGTLDDLVNRTLKAASFITDFRLNDQTANCQSLVGYQVYTVNKPSYELHWLDGKTYQVAGHTVCNGRYMVIGIPRSQNWYHSAIAHELLHAMQHCDAPQPTDDGEDSAHANWRRDNYYFAIDEANKEQP